MPILSQAMSSDYTQADTVLDQKCEKAKSTQITRQSILSKSVTLVFCINFNELIVFTGYLQADPSNFRPTVTKSEQSFRSLPLEGSARTGLKAFAIRILEIFCIGLIPSTYLVWQQLTFKMTLHFFKIKKEF